MDYEATPPSFPASAHPGEAISDHFPPLLPMACDTGQERKAECKLFSGSLAPEQRGERNESMYEEPTLGSANLAKMSLAGNIDNF